ncbi:MAG: hypothetical protein F4018_15000 [Acidobacteria bacterium]|nr:hypothetical protein [Acidobacteriota bacterium]
MLGYGIGMMHERTRRSLRATLVGVAACAVVAGLTAAVGGTENELHTGAAGAVTGIRLDGTVVSPLASAAGVEANVLLFVMTDCPISNRYAPEVRRLHDEFAGAVRFWLVYVDAHRPRDELREHRASFGYPFAALRDVDGALAALAGATVTPEAVVFDAAQRLVYRGRIDDRYVSFGVARRAPRTRDLHDRLRRLAAGETLAVSQTRAVGGYIPGA